MQIEPMTRLASFAAIMVKNGLGQEWAWSRMGYDKRTCLHTKLNALSRLSCAEMGP